MIIPTQFFSIFRFTLSLLTVFLFISESRAELRYLFRTVNVENGLPDNFIIGLASDSCGMVYIATKRGIVKFSGNDPIPVNDSLIHADGSLKLLTTQGSSQHESTKRTFSDSKGRLWIYDIFDYGLEWHQAGRRFLENSIIKSIGEAPDGKIWIATNNDGLAVIDPEELTLTRLRHDPTEPLSLPSNHITSLYIDSLSNSIWVGTSENGVGIAYLTPLDITFHSLDVKHDVSSFASRGDGRMLVGFDGGGLYQTGTGILKIPSEIVTNLLAIPDSDETLIATYGSGLFRLQDDKVTPLEQCGKTSPVAFSRQMLADAEGNLWIGTFSAGVSRLDKSGILKQFTIHNSPIGGDCIVGLDQSGDSVYMASTKAICSAAPGQDSLRRLPLSFKDDIRAFAVDKSGGRWISTKNMLYTPAGDSIRIQDIRAMTTDPQGRCWITGSRGVYVAEVTRSAPNRISTRFLKLSGISPSDFGKYALKYLPETGRIYAGLFGGYITFDPNSLDLLHSSAPVFADVTVNGKTHKSWSAVTLSPGDTILFTLRSANYVFPGNERLEYRLLPDTTAHPVIGNKIILSDLSSGNHTLIIKDLNSDSTLEYEIIQKRSWKWLWITMLAIGLIVGGICMLHRQLAGRTRNSHPLDETEPSPDIKGHFPTQTQEDTASESQAPQFKEHSGVPVNIEADQDFTPFIEEPSPLFDDDTVSALESLVEEEEIQSERKSPADKAFLAKVDAIIEREYANQEFSVEDFASEVGMSRSSLYKKLSQLTGLSPIEYLRDRRIQEGKKMLDEGHTSISQIAYSVGLSPKQFSRFFKDAYGSLPSEYKKC